MQRSQRLFLPPVALDRASKDPLHIQIYRQIARAIAGRHATADTRLPSTRAWSKLLGVSRNTVLAAYDELAAEGWIEGARGSGMFARVGAPEKPVNLLRAASFPERTAPLPDPDGNEIYFWEVNRAEVPESEFAQSGADMKR